MGAAQYRQAVMRDRPIFFLWVGGDQNNATTTDLVSGVSPSWALSGTTQLPYIHRGIPLVKFPSGDGQRLQSGTSANYTTALSLECWAWAPETQPSALAHLIGNCEYFASGVTEFPARLAISGGSWVFMVDSGTDFNTDATLTGSAPVDAAPVHLCGTFANGTSYLYENGRQTATATTGFNLSSPSNQWMIGRATNETGGGAGQSGYKGWIGAIALYNYQLPQSRVIAHHRAAMSARP